ncbi:thiamine-phosphate pyrophosphorylase [Faunimonas pinastri]|uniref:Thiamine-phosphate pyrophosphorylase n=1 Tax=Faunimonas pinastri TaxID=1855383 RepID=A0A1H8Z468_9HYPH|nr:thiamine phosphate synthase [Faunimonas pinastri]SEP59142.1 thiamine-phosphate pyrophosphorylase [Faunimonas pinastri]
MSEQNETSPRLFLVTPAAPDLDLFPDMLAEVLAASDVAAVLIASGTSEEEREDIAHVLVPIIQAAGAAAIIADATRAVGRCKADGVHIGSGQGDLANAVADYQPRSIVGAGNISSRHTAMEAAELGVDYIFFGKPYGDSHAEPHPKVLDLAAWWSDLMEVPAVVMAGNDPHSAKAAAETGASFVALQSAVWNWPDGPEAAIRIAAEAIEAADPAAA